MKTTHKHPSRTAILEAIKEGKIPFQEHLDQCESCRNLFEFLRDFHLAGQSAIVAPSETAMQRHIAIPLLREKISVSRLLRGFIVFDSWSGEPAFQLREADSGFVRHLRLKSGDITLEMVAESRPEGWEFTARVYKGRRVSSRWILQAGGKRMLPQSQGFYHWVSKRKPHLFRLITTSMHIDFEKLSW